jgi:hypothetical protein
VEYDVRIGLRVVRMGKSDAQCVSDRTSLRIRIDEFDGAPWQAPEKPSGETPDAATTDDGDAIARRGT